MNRHKLSPPHKKRPGPASRPPAGLVPAGLVVLALIVAGCADNLPGVSSTATTPSVVAGDYVGSTTCKTCHQSHYQSWKNSLHAKPLQTPSTTSVIADSDADGTDDFTQGVILGSTGGLTYSAGITQTFTDGYGVTLGVSGSTFTATFATGGGTPVTFNVTYAVAGQNTIQEFLTTIGNSEYVLPIRYLIDSATWDVVYPADWWTFNDANSNGTIDAGETVSALINSTSSVADVNDSYQRRCIGCHVTGLGKVTVNAGGEYYDNIADMLTAGTIKEINVACEACHGPGGNHVSLGGGIGTNFNPRKAGRVIGVEVCGRCHSTGTSKYVDATSGKTNGYPVKTDGEPYRPGDTLADAFTFDSTAWPNGVQGGKIPYSQYQDYIQSGMYPADVVCFDCHLPHGSAQEHMLIGDPDDNSVCLTCHGPGGRAESPWAADGDISDHTNHPVEDVDKLRPGPVGNESRCGKCHMLKVADTGLQKRHMHAFHPIEPRLDMPSSCMGTGYGTGCHSATAQGLASTTDGEPNFDYHEDDPAVPDLENDLRKFVADSAFQKRFPQYVVPTLTAVPTTADPDLADNTGGGLTDLRWNAAPVTTLPSGLKLQAMYNTGTGNITIRGVYADPTFSATRADSWQWNAGTTTWFNTSTTEFPAEDRLALNFNINAADYDKRGCGVSCHDNTAMGHKLPGEFSDQWHMKGARAMGSYNASTGASINAVLSAVTVNPTTFELTAGKVFISGYTDDKYIQTNPTGDGRTADAGTGPESSNKNGAGDAPLWMELNPTDYMDAMVLTEWEAGAGGEVIDADPSSGGYAGDAAVTTAWANYVALGAVVPERILKEPTGSRGDCRNAGVWDNGTWRIAFQRQLVTGPAGTPNGDDVQFTNTTSSAVYYFGAAIMDNGHGVNHTIGDKLVRLVFSP